MRLRALGCLALLACGGRGASSQESASPSIGEPAPIGTDGGLRVCTPEAKDMTPCSEDCDKKIAYACSLLAADAEKKGGPATAHRVLALRERACELADAPSCVNAARMYAAGTGAPPSRNKQVDLLARACTLGDAFACGVPAKAFASGNGVPRDDRKARDLWQSACASGIEAACAALGDAGL